jgi:hypothetical protein
LIIVDYRFHNSFEFIDILISFNKRMRKKAAEKGFSFDYWKKAIKPGGWKAGRQSRAHSSKLSEDFADYTDYYA